MGDTERSKGTWIHRFAIRGFTVALAVLFYWLIGFFLQDIRTIEGPAYEKVESSYIDGTLLEKKKLLDRQIAEISRESENLAERQRILGDSARSLQQTLNQILELQKQGLQKNAVFNEKQQAAFSESLNLFLENQRQYQALSRSISELTARKQQLEAERETTSLEIEKQRKPAREEFEKLVKRHRYRLALIQLMVLLPILLAAAWLIARKKGSLYAPILLALGAAVLTRTAFVIHEYFPSRVFRYILTLALIAAVTKLLVHFIRIVAFPPHPLLERQYREAYERFLCPVCEYPIRIGPRRFLFWTRRTVNRIIVPSGQCDPEEPYTCPSCGSRIFEKCPVCGQIRHSLLPYCTHCGDRKEANQSRNTLLPS
ncbi:MAG: hypothetical protein GX449_01350 [Synergistaceae bacterium]|nr:hypothetical protein [Synergistaceae bacterium]